MPKVIKRKNKSRNNLKYNFLYFVLFVFCFGLISGVIYFVSYLDVFSIKYNSASLEILDGGFRKIPKPVLNKFEYDRRLFSLSGIDLSLSTTTGTSTPINIASTTPRLWPPQTPYPNAGAILPFKRVIAFYGNFYSKGMGVLGEYEEDVMLEKLKVEVEKWQLADPKTPVIPAIHYIAVTAQEGKGDDGKYRARMPYDQIDYAIELAKKVDGIVFIDLQVGLSTIEEELPLFEKYLKMPQVHLAIDPEFYMRTGTRPGKYMGNMDAKEINYASEYLANLVRENDLPPKILVIHRFTVPMVTNYKEIKPLPEVQIVMDMDGWGSPERKKNTYQRVIFGEPVQFAGFKLFYKNDLRAPSSGLMAPEQVLKLRPKPIYIQYQ